MTCKTVGSYTRVFTVCAMFVRMKTGTKYLTSSGPGRGLKSFKPLKGGCKIVSCLYELNDLKGTLGNLK